MSDSLRVSHVITRLIIGGAQENTLHNVEDQVRLHGDEVQLITGPGLGAEGSLQTRGERSGARFDVIEQFHRNIEPWNDLVSYRQIVRRLAEFRPQLVHTHTSKAGILGRMAARKLGIPCVHTVHGAAFHFGQRRAAFKLYRGLERWAGRWTDHFICVCNAMTDQYVAAGVAPRARFTTIYSGFDVGPFLHPTRPPAETRAALGIRPDELVVGKIGRLFHLKGHQFLIEAAPAIVRAFPHVKFLLVGDGVLRSKYEKQIADLGLSGHFHFTGLVPPTQIAELIHAMDVVVHTSEWEGLARVLPQGLLAGKPVVSFDIDGAREVVVPGETGCLVPRGSVPVLTESVCRLLEDEALRHSLGAEGRRRFAATFDHASMTSRIRDVYRAVLEKRRPAKR